MVFTLEVSTNLEMPKAQFEGLARAKMLSTEISLNEDMRLRWHISEGKTVFVTNPKPE